MTTLTGMMIAAANEAAMQALRRAGVPLGNAQKLILSKSWREELRKNVATKIKQLETHAPARSAGEGKTK